MARSQLRILCFADSLTSGYHKWGLESRPYSIRLQERLNQAWPSTDVQIILNGLPADRVINGSYRSRLTSSLEQQHFDWIIILGGTNDLGWGEKSEIIYEALKPALETGAGVLALTVTESGHLHSTQGAVARRRMQDLNTTILSHPEERSYVAELAAAIPWPEDLPEQERIWDDGLHFTPVGYDMMGDAVADRLLELVDADAGQDVIVADVGAQSTSSTTQESATETTWKQ